MDQTASSSRDPRAVGNRHLDTPPADGMQLGAALQTPTELPDWEHASIAPLPILMGERANQAHS